MDLFGALPELRDSKLEALAGRSLRLISVSGFVYDENNFYFELSEPRNWGRLANGASAIGVRAPQVRPDGTYPLHQGIIQYVRRTWRATVELFPAGRGYVLDEAGNVQVVSGIPAHIPCLVILTPPRLGGGEMPDALVQAVYLLPMRRIRSHQASVTLLQFPREKLVRFLEPDLWSLAQARETSWITITPAQSLPEASHLQPVLALRSLRQMLGRGVLPGMLLADDRHFA